MNRDKKLCEPVRTGVKIYANQCEPKTYSCECLLKKYVNRCEPTENILWTGVKRPGKLCEPVRTVVHTNWKSCSLVSSLLILSFPHSEVPLFFRSFLPLFSRSIIPAFVAQFFDFFVRTENPSKIDSPSLFTEGVSQKFCDFPPNFPPRCSLLLSLNFFRIFFLAKIKKNLQIWVPHPFFWGGFSPFPKKKKNMCAFFPFFSRCSRLKIFS